MSATTGTPITHEWMDDLTPPTGFIYLNGFPIARVAWTDDPSTRVAGWRVAPAQAQSNGGVDYLDDAGAMVGTDINDREEALVMALIEVSKPDFRAAPKFATDRACWAHVKQKVEAQSGKAYDEWEPTQFKAAARIYTFTLRKYGENNPELAERYGIEL